MIIDDDDDDGDGGEEEEGAGFKGEKSLMYIYIPEINWSRLVCCTEGDLKS